MRVIIIDNSKEYMTRLRHMFAALYPDVEVTEYDPEQGRPESTFNWDAYDMLCIADQLCAMESGIAWLVTFGFHGNVPPTLFLAEDRNAFIEEKVRDLSRTLFALKPEIDVDTLKRLVEQLGVAEKEDRAEVEAVDPKFSNDRAVVATVAQKARSEAATDASDASYRFVRLIGQGAHSRVYLAERDEDKQTLVLKIMDLEGIDDPTTVQRFAREAELLSAIDSPYVVRVFDHGFTQTYGYTAVEFFTRGDLKQRVEHGIGTEEAVLYALNIAYGLEAIHRDLKPANIMFRSDDSLAIADFGISKHLGGQWDLTKTGSILGTLHYLSPEQGLGNEVDQRTDLYGLGMIFWELLTGEKAFQGGSPGALVYQHLYADIPKLPGHLAQYQMVMNRLLAKEPGDRYANAGEFIVHLNNTRAA